jgi:Fe-S-cluster containining protein
VRGHFRGALTQPQPALKVVCWAGWNRSQRCVLSRRDNLKLANVYEQSLDAGLKDQLRLIGARIYDLVALGVAEARKAGEPEGVMRALADAHKGAVTVFESECEGYFHNVRGGLELKRSLACTAGCTYCCHVKVEVTAFEATALWAEIRGESHAAQRQTALANAPRLSRMTTEARRAARDPCALLVDNKCSVYTSRPYVCRGMFATSAQDCERVLMALEGAVLPTVRSPAVPRGLASAFAAGANAALADQGLQHDLVELTSAFATLATRKTAVADWLTGQRIFEPTLPL